MKTITLTVCAFGACAAVAVEKPRMDMTKLNIGAYHLQKGACAEENVRDVRDCGIDFIIGTLDAKTLDLFAKYGLGVFQENVTPWWWGGSQGERNGRMHEINTMDKYEKAAKGFKDHPAIWAIDVGDEPSAMDFPHYGRIVRHTIENYPNQFPYLNLYPNYASAASLSRSQAQSQLGTATYREHLIEYCKHIPLDYICFDCYAWGWGNKPPVLIENLREVANAATGSRKDLWIVLQANTHIEGKIRNRPMSEETMRFQANAALAYGARLISWACWGKGWWTENAVDTNGVKTATYGKLKTVNAELHRIGERYMKYRNLSTDLVCFPTDYWKKIDQASVKKADDAAFFGVRAEDGAALAVGHMIAADGSGDHAIYVAACDDPEGETVASHRILFRTPKAATVTAWNEDGPVTVGRTEDGWSAVTVKTCRGILIEASAK